jgi:hypothetical protein
VPSERNTSSSRFFCHRWTAVKFPSITNNLVYSHLETVSLQGYHVPVNSLLVGVIGPLLRQIHARLRTAGAGVRHFTRTRLAPFMCESMPHHVLEHPPLTFYSKKLLISILSGCKACVIKVEGIIPEQFEERSCSSTDEVFQRSDRPTYCILGCLPDSHPNIGM